MNQKQRKIYIRILIILKWTHNNIFLLTVIDCYFSRLLEIITKKLLRKKSLDFNIKMLKNAIQVSHV